MENYSPSSGYMLATENSRDSIYDQNVPGTPIFFTLESALTHEPHLVPHSPAISVISGRSYLSSPGTWSPGQRLPMTPTTTPLTPGNNIIDQQLNVTERYLSSVVSTEELYNRLRQICSPVHGSPIATVPSITNSPFQPSTPSNNTSIDSTFANHNVNSSFNHSRTNFAISPRKLTTLSRSSLNNTPSRGLNISSDTLIMHDRNLASVLNSSSLASSMLSRPETPLRDCESSKSLLIPDTPEQAASSLFGSRMALCTPLHPLDLNISGQGVTPCKIEDNSTNSFPTTPILGQQARNSIVSPYNHHTLGTPTIQPPGSTPGTPMLATSTPAHHSKANKPSGSSIISSVNKTGVSVSKAFGGSEVKALMTGTPQTKRLATFPSLPGSAPSRLLALRAITSPGIKKFSPSKFQKSRTVLSKQFTVKRDLFKAESSQQTFKKEGLKALTGRISSLSGVFDEDSDNSEEDSKDEIAIHDGLGRTDIQADTMDTISPLDSEIEQDNVSFSSEMMIKELSRKRIEKRRLATPKHNASNEENENVSPILSPPISGGGDCVVVLSTANYSSGSGAASTSYEKPGARQLPGQTGHGSSGTRLFREKRILKTGDISKK